MPASPPPLLSCSVCQTTLDPNGTCPRCRAPEDWNDQIEALDFVVRRLKEWQEQGHLKKRQMETLADMYDKRRQIMTAASAGGQTFQADATFPRRDMCWSCGEYLYTNSSHCHDCGAPISDPGVRSLRYLNYLCRELRLGQESGMLTLRQALEFIGDVNERIAALQGKLERERAPMVLPVQEESQPRRRRRVGEEPLGEEGPKRTFLEILVDPQSIQWLLAAGGSLIVLGMVIWLLAIGMFKNPGFVAIMLGIGNAALIAGGWALILRTSHQYAGRAVTLLACLVMPLNLWFYHSQELMKLENNLWIAALICCAIYTASAFVLKDSLFVYVLVGGVTLTGMLILAQYSHFGETLGPTTFLIVLGLICLHVERAFPPIEGPFSRQSFGMAFFWSAQALFASGLLLLLGAQIVGWLHEPLFRLVLTDVPQVAEIKNLPWTIVLTLAGTYAYIYSDLVVRRIGVYIYFAAITLLWAEIQLLVWTDLAKVEALVMVTLALTALVVNILQIRFKDNREFLRFVPPLGMVLSLIPVAWGVLLHFRATNIVLNKVWPVEAGLRFEISWPLVGAMALTALCCRAGAYLYRRTLREVSVVYFFATAAATLVFAAGLTWMMGLKPWETEAPLVMIVPILYLIASYLYRGHTPEKPLIWAGHAAVGIMLFCSVWVAWGITEQVVNPIEGDNRNLLLSLFCLEVTIFYGVATYLQRTNWTMYLAAVMFCGAVWQLLKYFHTPDEFYVVAFALAGFVLLVLYRFGVFEHLEMAGLDRGIFQSANALTTLGFTSGALLSLSRFALHEDAAGEWRDRIRIILFVLIFLLIISLCSVWLVQHQVWRRVHIVFSIINSILLVLVIHKLATLDPWQRVEIFTIVLGLLLLGFGYVGWYRETERSSDLVSMAFIFGSIALVAPLFLATAIWRFRIHRHDAGLDDLGLIMAGVALFGTGILCRIKAPTLIGSAGMVLYLLVIVIDLHRHLEEQWIIGIYLTLGGVVLVCTALFLSIYRDRLLALPDRIRRREGVFRIFDWR